MLTGMLRVFADIGTQAEWLLIFLAAVVGVFVLVCALAAFVAIFTTNPDQRQICYRIFRALLRFFHRRQDT